MLAAVKMGIQPPIQALSCQRSIPAFVIVEESGVTSCFWKDEQKTNGTKPSDFDKLKTSGL